MSYSGYAASSSSHRANSGQSDADTAATSSSTSFSADNNHTNTQSGHLDFMALVGTTKHKRMMGRIKAKPAQRVSLSSSGGNSNTNSNAVIPAPVRIPPTSSASIMTSARRVMTSTTSGSSLKASAFKPRRPMPISMPTPEPTATATATRMTTMTHSQHSYQSISVSQHHQPEQHQEQIRAYARTAESVSAASPVLRSRSQPPATDRTPLVPPAPSPILEESALSSASNSMHHRSREDQPRPLLSNSSAAASGAALAALASNTSVNIGNAYETIFVNGNPYSILKKIGKGGSSVVYEVFDSERQLRAIKKVDLSEADEDCARGYINEIHMLERLQGNHRIIRLFEYEHSGDTLYVVMERGDTDLATLLRRMTSISHVQRKFYWAEMLEAVQVIHRAGIIHSDLKPANFLMVQGSLKLIDFGIATSVQSDKTSVIKDNQFGTFNFMSPEALMDLSTDEEEEAEIANGGSHKPRIKISFKTDVWSLGCILYHLTYRKLPFGDFKQPWKKLEAIIDPNYAIKYPASSDVDPLLLQTIQQCLVRDPGQRASVEELLAHEYVTAGERQAEQSGAGPTGKGDLSTLFDSLSNVLTPNTRMGLSRAMQKLSSSDTNLDALKKLDFV